MFKRSGMLALAVASALAIGIGGAAANEPDLRIELLPQDQAKPILTHLMQPVQPFIEGNAATTTTIAQIGATNYASSYAEGTSNLSAIAQAGSNNRAAHAIQGSNSALLLVQGGSNNNVLQASVGDGNFQLVGVSGHNNNVGYVQIGNELAGALNVSNARNSNVIAIQTPGSAQYLMPTGLHGLRNHTVIIGPGRMHVIPHR